MYKQNKPAQTAFNVNKSTEGEPIEKKVARILNNKEKITDTTPIIFTERKDGVKAEYDIRTDRWEHAIDGMDYVTKSKIASREERAKARDIAQQAKEGMKKEGDTPEPTSN